MSEVLSFLEIAARSKTESHSKNWKILHGVGILIRDAVSGIASHGEIACCIEILTTFQCLIIHFSQGTS